MMDLKKLGFLGVKENEDSKNHINNKFHAIVSGVIYKGENGADNDIEIISMVDDDTYCADVFCDIENELRKTVEPVFNEDGDYLFFAKVEAEMVPCGMSDYDGSAEYDVEYTSIQVIDSLSGRNENDNKFYAIVSAHIYKEENEKPNGIEIITMVHDDIKGADVFWDIEDALLDNVEPVFDDEGCYLFFAKVEAEFVRYDSWEGVEYEVEYPSIEVIDSLARLF